LKDIEREILNERKKRVENMKKEQKIEEMQEKEKKIQEILDQKNQMIKEREKAQYKLIQQKKEMLRQINQLQKKNKELDPETIKNIFPDDEELINDIIKMKERQKEEEKKRKLDNYEEEEEEDENEKVNKTFSTQAKIIRKRNKNYDEEDDEDYKERQRKETYINEYNKRVRAHNQTAVKSTSKSIALEKNISEPSKTEDNYKSVKVMYSQNLNKNKSNIIPLTNAELKTQNNREKSKTNRVKNYKSLTKKREQKSTKNPEYVEFRNKKISLPEISNYYNKPKKIKKFSNK
jgi:hypothetical protein